MCYIHIAALIAEYLKRKGKMLVAGGGGSPEIHMLKLKINLLTLHLINLSYVALSNIHFHRYFS
jgi:hypothetical protein